MISEAIKQTGGKQAANYLLGEKFIDAYSKIAKEGTLIFDTASIKPEQKVEEAFHLLDKLNLDKDS